MDPCTLMFNATVFFMSIMAKPYLKTTSGHFKWLPLFIFHFLPTNIEAKLKSSCVFNALDYSSSWNDGLNTGQSKGLLLLLSQILYKPAIFLQFQYCRKVLPHNASRSNRHWQFVNVLFCSFGFGFGLNKISPGKNNSLHASAHSTRYLQISNEIHLGFFYVEITN